MNHGKWTKDPVPFVRPPRPEGNHMYIVWRAWLVALIVCAVPFLMEAMISRSVAAGVAFATMLTACLAMLAKTRFTVWCVIAMPAASSVAALCFPDRELVGWHIIALLQVCILCLAWAGHVRGYVTLGPRS